MKLTIPKQKQKMELNKMYKNEIESNVFHTFNSHEYFMLMSSVDEVVVVKSAKQESTAMRTFE